MAIVPLNVINRLSFVMEVGCVFLEVQMMSFVFCRDNNSPFIDFGVVTEKIIWGWKCI